ncbi:hypothetical protein CIPAW_13G178200, partial [Carya illinoinensis]
MVVSQLVHPGSHWLNPNSRGKQHFLLPPPLSLISVFHKRVEFFWPFLGVRVAAMSDASHSRNPSMETDQDGYRDHQDDQQDIDGRGYRLVIPEDGYEWKKYGQKFIKNIGKVRSYFKCQRSNCGAKKRADWSTLEAGSLRVVYDGVHSHELPSLISQADQRHHG